MKIEKLKTFCLLLVLAFTFVSCSSDDDASQDQTTQARLIGKWLFESTVEDYPSNACEKTSFLEFHDAENADSVLFTENSEGSCIALLTGDLSYELLSETMIKFTNPDADVSTFNSEIISVSDTKLVLKNFAFIQGNIVFKKVP